MNNLLEEFLAADHDSEYLESTARALLRHLLSHTPSRAEDAWVNRKLLSSQSEGWFEVRDPSDYVAYIYKGETGLYQRTPPSGVSLTTVHRVPGPHFELREFAARLAEKLSDNIESEKQWKRLLGELQPSLVALGNGTFEQSEVNRFLSESFRLANDKSGLDKFWEDYCGEIRTRFTEFKMPGYLYGYICLLDEAWSVAPSVRQFTVATLFPAIQRVPPITSLLHFIFGVFADNDEMARIERAAASLQLQGETNLKKAKTANTSSEYYDGLYQSCPLLYAAYRGYDFLRQKDEKKYGPAAIACEELMLRSYVPLEVNFENYVGAGYVDIHRRAIEERRNTKGESAAKLLAKQYIDLDLLYPPIWRDYLLGKTNQLPK